MRVDIDGILSAARLTGNDRVAVYDRAVTTKLKAGNAIPPEYAAGLISALSPPNVSVRMDLQGGVGLAGVRALPKSA